MIPTAELAQSIGQSVLRCMEKYEKDTGKRASKVLIQLSDTSAWQRGDSAVLPDDTRSFSLAGINYFAFSVMVQDEPESA